jgi:tetratricopeptide (TPR) repeat protein
LKPFTLIFILLAACLVSCHVEQSLMVPVDYAPKLTLGHDTTTVLLVNRFSADSLKINNKRKLGVLKGAAYTAIVSAAKQLKLLHGVNAINLADSVNFVADTDSVKQLAANYKAKYVLTLDNFSANINEEVVDNNSVYSTVVYADFTLYESNGVYSKKLSGKTNDFHSEEPYYGIVASLLFHPTIKGNAYSINKSAGNAAIDALKDYLPSTVTNNRPLYDNNDSLKVAVIHIKAGDYDKAFHILNALIDAPDMKLASCAAYNLAVVYEAQGDIEAALEVAKISDEKKPNWYAKTIIADLQKE